MFVQLKREVESVYHLPYVLKFPPFLLSSFSSSTHSRRSRETGVHEEAELEAPRAVFDYVDEDEYARIVQERQEEGFVLDDGGWSPCHHATDTISSSTYQVVIYQLYAL